MPVAPPASNPSRALASPRRRSSTLLIALALQAALLAVTLLVMVKQDQPVEPPAFVGERAATAALDPKRSERRLRELKRRMSKPRSFHRLAVDSESPSALPAAPVLPKEAFDLDASASSLFEDANAALIESGLGAMAGSLSRQSSAAEFFGLRDSGERIVILVNTSASVARKARNRGVSMEEIQAQAAKLIDGLRGGTLFGIVQFSQGARSFGERLAPALKSNKAVAVEWIRERLKGNPPIEDEAWLGHEAGFRSAMSLRPDVIFLVTDGALNRRQRKGSGYAYPEISYDQLLASIEREMRENGSRPRIHVVGFELGEEQRRGLRRLTEVFGGTLREF